MGEFSTMSIRLGGISSCLIEMTTGWLTGLKAFTYVFMNPQTQQYRSPLYKWRPETEGIHSVTEGEASPAGI
ncbi:hypothetical protein LEMLEM_LOCUS11251 [Lemmus lemmus]